MAYRCVAASVAGFVQQLAVGYISNGYYFYVTGVIPEKKDPANTDRKILEAYDIAVSKWTRARRKKEHQANVQNHRHGRFYVIIATHGFHQFFVSEATRLHDIRKRPILFMGYSIGCRRERGGDEYHASVRINRELYRELKAKFEHDAVNGSLEKLLSDLLTLPYEPYAPIRTQYLGLLRAVNRRRAVASLERLPIQVLRLHRSPVRPFNDSDTEDGDVLDVLLGKTDGTDSGE